ncbi:PP2C family protein-serine/threonine phosphatase [Streptomyces sp. JH34]|uniref:PP2C family protein-serine/threonine phosphatase n=1 Tax=Streptomyces sp. JH34 TaxID=2793633 RepID=UPI0023F8689B|nr:PP2C family protein-serine/threonine phosphatase [Streptomyces sp. JH34]MDF6022813.1 serine/threonine-protein phosphatase [Streptomyces sp. JH34]
MGLRRPSAAHRAPLPGVDVGEESAGASRIGNAALALWLFLLTAAVVVLDAFTGDDLPVIPLLVVLPALTSVFCSVRQTTAVAVWVTAVVVATRIPAAGAFWDVLFLIGFTALASSLGVVACAARIRHATEVARLRTAAVALQRQILRPLPIVTRQICAHGLYEPIEEDRFVGGDIYEVVQSPHGTRVIIGDVQGKGLPAIGAGFAALGAFREAAVRESDIVAVADSVEDAVVRHNAFTAETGEAERFVTALVLGFDGSDRVRVVNCGHLAPRLMHAGTASVVTLHRTSVPLGMADLSREPRAAEWIGFPPDAALLVFTDGVTEARDATGDFYPFDERLGRWTDRDPDQVLVALQADLEGFSGGVRRDDVAVLLLSRPPDRGSAAATPGGDAVQRPAQGHPHCA